MGEMKTLGEPAWLSGEGPESQIVLSSRVRLARNLVGYPFAHKANPDELAQIFEVVRDAISKMDGLRKGQVVRIDRTTPLDRQYLLERHLISPDLANKNGPRGVVIGEGESLGLMINEEDHLRIQGMFSGFEPMKAWQLVNSLDDGLSASLEVAFSENWGYLTACPTNTGTGLRASVLIHLPALVLTKQISKVLRGITQVGLAVRGMFGEGTEVMGNFFQISNQTTLGLSERDTLDSLSRVTRQIIDHEKSASEVLLESARLQVEDKVFRAFGILSHCRVISSHEVLSLISAVRFGRTIGILEGVDIRLLNRVMIETLPAHLQKGAGEPLDQVERDYRRAELVRGLLAK